jgi:hypothetical protein
VGLAAVALEKALGAAVEEIKPEFRATAAAEERSFDL